MATNNNNGDPARMRRTRRQGIQRLELDDFERNTLDFLALQLGLVEDAPTDFTYGELKEAVRDIEAIQEDIANQPLTTIRRLLREWKLSDAGGRRELTERFTNNYLEVVTEARDMDATAKQAMNQNGGVIRLVPRVPDGDMFGVPQIPGYIGLDTPGRRQGGKIFPTAGDSIRHEWPEAPGYLPDYIESLYFPGVQPPSGNYVTQWYVIGNDCNDRRNVRIALLHSFNPESTNRQEERPGQFDHCQFRYDREWDFTRGVSRRRWGGRTGPVPERPGIVAARARLGIVDDSWFPLDSLLIQAAITKWKRARQGGRGNRRRRGNANIDPPNNNPYQEIPPNCPVRASDTGVREMPDNTPYTILIHEFQHCIRQHSDFMRRPANDPPPSEEDWYPIILRVLEITAVLPYQVKQELLFGAHEDQATPDTNRNLTTDSNNLDRWANEMEAWRRVGDPTIPLPAKPLPSDFHIITTVELAYLDSYWDQRRRFLWPAIEEIGVAALDGMKRMELTLLEYDRARAAYSDYWADEVTVQNLLDTPEHPHPIDPVVAE